jgi:hypothetical protein
MFAQAQLNIPIIGWLKTWLISLRKNYPTTNIIFSERKEGSAWQKNMTFLFRTNTLVQSIREGGDEGVPL